VTPEFVEARARAPRHTVRRRTSADVVRLGWFLLVLLVGLALSTVADETMAGVEADLLQGLSQVPDTVTLLVVIAAVVLYAAVMLGTPVVLLLTRRFRTLLVGGLALVLASVAFEVVSSRVPIRTAALPDGEAPLVAVEQATALPSPSLATYTAVAVVVGVELSVRWRRALWVLLVLLAVLALVTATNLPLDVVLAIGVGGVVGTVLLLAFGRSLRVVSAAGVQDVLERSGIVTDSVEPLEHQGAWEYRARTALGPLLVKVVGHEDRQVDTLYRTYRRVRLRDVGDDTPYSSARRAVAVESLLTIYAGANGVRAPAVRAITPVGHDEVVLAVDDVGGRSLAELPLEQLTDDVLRQCWHQVQALRSAQVAHRSLELANLRLDDQGRVWLVNFDFGQPAAEPAVLAGDVAELLAATSVRVGADRAVAAAHDILGSEPLEQAVVRLVPAALTRSTRDALRKSPDGPEPLVAELCRVTGVEKPQLAKVERLRPRYLVMGAMLTVAIYVLLPQLANVPQMVDAVREADWRWVPAVLAASVLTYVGAGLALVGATPGRVSVGESGLVALASSFVATVAPPGVGQVGLNIRYLQKRGFAAPIAVSASAAKEGTVLIVHLTLLAVFAVWAGRSGALQDELERLPPAGVVAAISGALLVVAGIAAFTPPVRRLVRESVVPAVRSSVTAMGDVVRSPAKMTMLLVGVTLLPMGYAVCLFFSVEAFGGGASFAAVALVYLTAGSVAAAAPTPGGVGAVEAVLLAALTGIGLASAEALAAVFMFRLATFWLPILPGALSLRWLTARDIV
jgi:undecaprenyl-diphosphatase